VIGLWSCGKGGNHVPNVCLKNLIELIYYISMSHCEESCQLRCTVLLLMDQTEVFSLHRIRVATVPTLVLVPE
jgi:hypothetical protein